MAMVLCLTASTFGAMRASYSATFPEHISELMSVYLDPLKNFEWNQRMSTQVLLRSPEHGEIVHQTYKLPWPLKPRELLMQCRNQVSHREHTLTASCRSVESKACPITSDAVRMEILESQWTFEALPPGGKMSTKVSVYILINERFAVGIPSWVVKYVQAQSLKDTVHQYHKACLRLSLPPHLDFLGWRRTRASGGPRARHRARCARWAAQSHARPHR